MNWKQNNRIASYFRSSLWVIPIAALILEQIFILIVLKVDAHLSWSGLGLGVEGARALCNAVVNLTLSFTVFTFASLLVAIQVASGQYTPRIIATTLLRDNVIRYTVGLFVFTFIFAIKALNRVETSVPQLVIFLTGLFGFACIICFLFLIDYAARLLRPVSLVRSVGEAGLAVLDSVYPDELGLTEDKILPESELKDGARTILHRGTSAIVLAVNVEQLMTDAVTCGA